MIAKSFNLCYDFINTIRKGADRPMDLFAAQLIPGADRHAAAYALLRYAVQRTRGIPCPEIARTPGGKPYFIGTSVPYFSLSHTKTHVLAALSEHEIGADIETRRRIDDRLRDRLFTPEEQREFDFFDGWTLREAIFKLTGAGGLMTMRLARTASGISTPFPDVRCRSYDDIPGCAVAVACREDSFPDKIEIVAPTLFFT